MVERKNILKYYRKAASKAKADSYEPLTEMKITKDILLGFIDKRLNKLELYIERIKKNGMPGGLEEAVDHYGETIVLLNQEKDIINYLPNAFYTVQRLSSNVLEINGLHDEQYELAFSRKIIGGSVYELKDVTTCKKVEFISEGYLSKLESNAINGYLVPDEIFSEALSQLKCE